MGDFLQKILGKIDFLANLQTKITLKTKIDFLDQLGSLLSSGIPITNSLKIIKFQAKSKNLKRIIDIILDDTNKGVNFKDALGKFPHIFGVFDISIIEMGEVTGKIDTSIATIQRKEEKTRELSSKIISALIYPAIIITLSIIMIGVFMVYVIPKIQDMYKDAKVNLPPLTQYVINASNFLKENYLYLIIAFLLFVLFTRIFAQHKKTKIYFDTFVLKIPIFGRLIKKKILTNFSFSLGVLLSSGVMINQSLEISTGIVENERYKREILKIIIGISQGQNLSTLLGVDSISTGKENPLFPIDLSGAVKIGEQTGRLSQSFAHIAEKFEKDIDIIVKNMQTLIEPLVIVVVGGIVGALILAIMLPFFNMVNVL